VIDDVTVVVEDINVAVGIAANIAANVCGVAVPVAVLAQQVVFGAGEFTCMNDSGDTEERDAGQVRPVSFAGGIAGDGGIRAPVRGPARLTRKDDRVRQQ